MSNMQGTVALLSLLLATSATAFSGTFTSKLARRDVSANIDTDPFYVPPTGYESSAQGTVFRNRSIVPDATLGVGIVGYELLFRTTGATGLASYAVTTILVPSSTVPDVLISYQTAEGNYTNAAAVSEEALIAALLAQNLTVAVPDYEGPNSTFSAGRVAGHGVLDGALAALSFLGQGNSTKVVGIGYSGGAIATGWAAALHPTYAPQLNVVGWSQGGTPANATATFEYVNGGIAAGFAFAGFEGLMEAYPTVRTFIEGIETTALAAALAFLKSSCEVNILIAFEYASLFNTTYQPYGDALLSQSELVPVLQAKILGLNATETPSAPVFIYHAVEDQTIPIAPVDYAVSQYCANGIKSLDYQRVTGNATHSSTATAFAPLVIEFVARSLAGVVTSGCSITNISIASITASSTSTSAISANSSAVPTGKTTSSAAPQAGAKFHSLIPLSLFLVAAALSI
ncbi:hypothetical protein RQP46_006836 [Phenoliferia psychrophenolica]